MEAKLWDALRALKPLGWHFRRQVPIGRYFADFACHHGHLVVEVDGETHTNVSYDAKRDEFVRGAGYHVLRVSNRDVSRNLDGVVTSILAELEGQPISTRHRRLAHPSPRWGGTEGGVGPQTQDDGAGH